MTSAKPLPLKQRTSSIDARRDYNTETWFSVLGLLKLREYLITVDHFSIWRRHLAWALNEGKDLRDYMTQRYSSSMVFMSLLLSTELGVLFNSAPVTTHVRQSLAAEDYTTLSFWAGIVIIFSAILTLLGLISTFTAWTMVSAVSPTNAHCVLRSSIGQYAAELPGRFIVSAIYSFLLWLMIFFFLLLPVGFWSLTLCSVVFFLFFHVITTFSAFGRIIMHSGAMGSNRIFEERYEASLLPHSLHANLLTKAKANLANNTSITRQYRSKMQAKPIDRSYNEDELSSLLSGRPLQSNSPPKDQLFPSINSLVSIRSNDNNSDLPPSGGISNYENSYEQQTRFSTSTAMGTISPTRIPKLERPGKPTRKRTASLVKFADGLDTNGDRYDLNAPSSSQPHPLLKSNTSTSNVSASSSYFRHAKDPNSNNSSTPSTPGAHSISTISEESPLLRTPSPGSTSSLLSRPPSSSRSNAAGFPPPGLKSQGFGRIEEEDEDNRTLGSVRSSGAQSVSSHHDGNLIERWLSASERSDAGPFSMPAAGSSATSNNQRRRPGTPPPPPPPPVPPVSNNQTSRRTTTDRDNEHDDDEKKITSSGSSDMDSNSSPTKSSLQHERPRKISVMSSISTTSSYDAMDSTLNSNLEGLTDDERFDLEYGEDMLNEDENKIMEPITPLLAATSNKSKTNKNNPNASTDAEGQLLLAGGRLEQGKTIKDYYNSFADRT